MSIIFNKETRLEFQSIILSAGLSVRMGEDKALLKVNGEPAIIGLIKKNMVFSDKIYIVLGNNYPKIKSIIVKYGLLEQVKLLENKYPEKGMFTSVKIAFKALKNPNPIVFQLIDHPFVSLESYTEIINAYDSSLTVLKPYIYDNMLKRSGHPIVLNYKIREAILLEHDESNLKNVLARFINETKFIEIRDRAIIQNINTKKEFKIAEREINGNNGS